jgi:hypothetical protein
MVAGTHQTISNEDEPSNNSTELIFTMSKPHSFQYPSIEIGLGAGMHVHRSPMNLYISFTKPLN